MRNKTEEEFGKGMSLLFVASFFVEQAKRLLKDSTWFRARNRNLLNLLIDENYYLIAAQKKIQKLISDDKKLEEANLLKDFPGNKEDVQYLWTTEKRIFANFMKIYFDADDNQIESLGIDLQAIIDGKKLYQYEVLESILNRWNSHTGNVVQYNKEFIDEFLNEYR